MIRFIAAKGVAVCSISIIVKQLESTRSNVCTKRQMSKDLERLASVFPIKMISFRTSQAFTRFAQ